MLKFDNDKLIIAVQIQSSLSDKSNVEIVYLREGGGLTLCKVQSK